MALHWEQKLVDSYLVRRLVGAKIGTFLGGPLGFILGGLVGYGLDYILSSATCSKLEGYELCQYYYQHVIRNGMGRQHFCRGFTDDPYLSG